MRRLYRALADWWLDRRCRMCQRRIDWAILRGDYASASYWQRRLEKIAGWDT